MFLRLILQQQATLVFLGNVGNWIWLEFSQTSIQVERSKGKSQDSSDVYFVHSKGFVMSISLNNVVFLALFIAQLMAF